MNNALAPNLSGNSGCDSCRELDWAQTHVHDFDDVCAALRDRLRQRGYAGDRINGLQGEA